jgi:hypothetical protein
MFPRKSKKSNQTHNHKVNQRHTDAEKTNRLLGEINEFQLTQQRGIPPRIPDVMFPEMRRNKVYSMIKTNVSSVTTSATVDTSAAFNWSVSGVNGLSAADITAVTTLFDSWRIIAVEFTIIPNYNSATSLPLYSVIDYDDSTVLPAVGNATAYDTVMVTQGGAVHTRILQPRCADALYSGSAFTNYGQELPGKWCDLSSSSTPHYGVKFYLPANSSIQTLTTVSRIVYQFKNNR